MTDTSPVPPVPPLPATPGPRGMRLLAFLPAPEATRFEDAPVAYALVALWWRGRVLMVDVCGRDCWELPGGGIEHGESPRQAAVRELWEETGQPVPAERLRFAGFAKTALGSPQRVLYGAVFTAETVSPLDFTPNEEIRAIHWRQGEESLPGASVLQTVDAYLAAICRP